MAKMAAGGGGDRLPVNCGVNLSGNSFVICYDVGRNVDKKNIMWNWHADGDNVIATLECKTSGGDIKYHNSAPISKAVHSKLGSAKSSLEGSYFKVTLKKKAPDVPDLTQFFDVSQ